MPARGSPPNEHQPTARRLPRRIRIVAEIDRPQHPVGEGFRPRECPERRPDEAEIEPLPCCEPDELPLIGKPYFARRAPDGFDLGPGLAHHACTAAGHGGEVFCGAALAPEKHDGGYQGWAIPLSPTYWPASKAEGILALGADSCDAQHLEHLCIACRQRGL